MPRITGDRAAKDRIRSLASPEKVELVSRALFAAGEIIRSEAAFLITEGAVSGKNHVPSAPGQPPNEDTGQLRRGLRVEQPSPLRVLVTSNAPYAAALEFGTSKMIERPYMRPAMRAKKDDAVALVRRAVDKAIGK